MTFATGIIPIQISAGKGAKCFSLFLSRYLLSDLSDKYLNKGIKIIDNLDKYHYKYTKLTLDDELYSFVV